MHSGAVSMIDAPRYSLTPVAPRVVPAVTE